MTQDEENHQAPRQQVPLAYAPLSTGNGGRGPARIPSWRPGSITGLAVFSLIVGILLLGSTGLGYLGTLSVSETDFARYKQTYPELAEWEGISLPLKLIGGFVMVVASLGLISLRRWAPVALLGSIVLVAIITGFSAYYLATSGIGKSEIAGEYRSGMMIGALLWPAGFTIQFIWALGVFSTSRARAAIKGEPPPIAGHSADTPFGRQLASDDPNELRR